MVYTHWQHCLGGLLRPRHCGLPFVDINVFFASHILRLVNPLSMPVVLLEILQLESGVEYWNASC